VQLKRRIGPEGIKVKLVVCSVRIMNTRTSEGCCEFRPVTKGNSATRGRGDVRGRWKSSGVRCRGRYERPAAAVKLAAMGRWVGW
jgi:hypothetical protein